MFHQQSREQRQKSLFDQFNFICECRACEQYFPTANDLLKIDENFQMPQDDPNNRKEKLQNIFKENCDFIDENIVNFPSFDVCKVMQNNLMILQELAKDVV